MRPGRAQNKDNCKQTSSGNFLHQFILLYNDKPAATTALLIGCLSRAAGVMKCSEPPELIIRNFVFNVRQEMSKAEEEQVCINIHSVMCHGLKTVEGNEGNVRLRQQDGRFAPLQQCVWISEQRENIHTEYAQPLRRHMIQSAGPRCSPGSRGDDDSRLPPSPEPTKPARGCQDKQRLPTLWVTVETAPGLPGLVGTKGLWVSIILSASSSSSTSKPSNHRAK
ncbi:uncharacterized protein LOC102314601 isoform X3 [Haplochromis burtoni]|uniref:uncharacterized protein LOC102314601 isoform X3 n=1 Tax=Haplochromis burtoni TaxID=8153 RepID=UPI001C2D5325|nr:uncharacterized protein LOC102314601 isoform X3 [Haplochromis burtoni]